MMEVKRRKERTDFLLCLFVMMIMLIFMASAVPVSRSLQFADQEPTVFVGEDQMVTREMRVMEEEIARMAIEKDDYPGSGANNRHDPKSPGRA